MTVYDEGDEQYLYSLYAGRHLLYVGISDSWTRRMGQHQRQKPWFPEVTMIKVKRHPSREAVSAAERKAIRAKRPLYNIQHNQSAQFEMEVSPEDLQRGMASLAAMICGALLAARWAADAFSAWWIRQRAGDEPLTLPPVRNPFTESPPHPLLTLMTAYAAIATGKADLPDLRPTTTAD